jgi:hypothetical protein
MRMSGLGCCSPSSNARCQSKVAGAFRFDGRESRMLVGGEGDSSRSVSSAYCQSKLTWVLRFRGATVETCLTSQKYVGLGLTDIKDI